MLRKPNKQKRKQVLMRFQKFALLKVEKLKFSLIPTVTNKKKKSFSRKQSKLSTKKPKKKDFI